MGFFEKNPLFFTLLGNRKAIALYCISDTVHPYLLSGSRQ
jgi:hypothetical protein